MTDKKFRELMENSEPDFTKSMEEIYAEFAANGYDEDLDTFVREVSRAREQITDENGELREEYLDMVAGGRTSWSCSVHSSMSMSICSSRGHYRVAFYVSVAVCVSVRCCR